MSYEDLFDMPGGDDFVDVKDVFEEAARDMQPGQLVFTEGFTIQDAMSAIEIGEPRMDSGMIAEANERPEFQPLTPLLPEEVCWIMDRALACELELHAGNALAQTVYTLLYVHHLKEIDPDVVMDTETLEEDPDRPAELITLVIRATVMGILKCCDLAWRELSKNRVHEGEDWQGEKCEISLLEGYPVRSLVRLIDQAAVWCRHASGVSVTLRNELLARLLFRKTMLELMTLNLPEDHDKLQTCLATARDLLQGFRSRPIRTPHPGSPAHLVFDPYVTRRLHSFMPLRPMQLPPQEETWNSLEAALDNWQELYYLCTITSMSTWKILGYIRIRSPRSACSIPFLRSLAQSFFYDGSRFIRRFQDLWIIERFCEESMGVKYDYILQLMQRSWAGEGQSPLMNIQRLMIKTLMPYIRSFWFNPPRQRRFLSKSLVDWHVLYAAVQNLVSECVTEDQTEARMLDVLPKALLLWRLEVIQQVVLSGFQLELYSPDEVSVAYWYAAEVIVARLECLHALMEVAPPDSTAYSELHFQHSFLTALHGMCLASALKMPSISWGRSHLNFRRRYKWAFKPEYNDVPLKPVAQPDFEQYMTWRAAETSTAPESFLESSRSLLLELLESPPVGWAGLWRKDRFDFVTNLAETCTQMIANCPPGQIRYNADANPLFPIFS
ncbi:hypothetical protein GLOTRDRAFT_118272 [Gloeophyllum trabeum ATCC 11539]|uniref:Mak10-domain-containing protein n=1 Tax=Gloeophyllum trabeum (strain ATCC 11539 / FP-39264 / Madison 617) TaxID=670483 RepID=S7RDS0_GLOTA|nr:uncharacterized protein GLOTRDRAFT_118272 [Gloeophyllum trabeum ATCC 11539]EPQ50584.1 hypothetical protein GLOTRDRAFT_118272 [Gloeophyllum trabeum ATCC 11539]